MTVNLLLGVFIPSSKAPHIWELDDDDYLHNAPPTFYAEHPEYRSPEVGAVHNKDRKETFSWLPSQLAVRPSSQRRYRADSLPRTGSAQRVLLEAGARVGVAEGRDGAVGLEARAGSADSATDSLR